MQAEHLKGWLEEASKVEALSVKAAEEATKATIGPAEEGTEAERDTGNEKELTN